MVHLIADRAGTTALTGSLDRIDAEALAAAVEHATVREVDPGTVTLEQGRFPSARLAEFIRCRDLTCRFPGCDVPAWDTDIDHTVAWPAGPTHPSKLRC